MITEAYIHSDKDSMWELGEQLGLKDEALMLFRHACCEVKVSIDVDIETGNSKIIAVDDRKVEHKEDPFSLLDRKRKELGYNG